ncbi:tripartite tricarboxylate transporter substrate binding protein [Pigmentiphaga sp. H8]|uniref:Bug family tripartite tricarboxylate transporter substrate binding protein n=1 Tax=Pigmentiphaga sp. H8 TaxID=2488560 RepID=UPI000F5A26D7|nr:tripartite tricarboxylate transporter substrate binding protein [Pigmentiphaga sp. H8]AZG09272.1 tripartite tricarboxylate transporter substrate binding protein [Pigmentiphaga sp. H8]
MPCISHRSAPRRRRLVAFTVLSGGLLATGMAHGADAPWPTQPIKLIVGFPAGTSPDTVARLIAEPLSQKLGKPVIVENKPGAAGNIGVDLVARATDGHTFGVTAHGPLTTSALLYPNLPYDVARDLQPLSLAAVSPQILVIDPKLPYATLHDLLADARARHKEISYGSVGVGSGSHLTGELFAQEAGIRMMHVPYQGFPQVTMAVMSGQIQAGFMAPSGAIEQAKAGKVRVLGVTSAQPSPLAPGVPTVAQAASLPGFAAELWIGAYAPRATPAPVAAMLAKEINAILRSAPVRAKLAAQGWEATGGSPADMAARIETDTRRWGEVIKRLGIKLE